MSIVALTMQELSLWGILTDMADKKNLFLALAILSVLALGAGFWYWQKKSGDDTSSMSPGITPPVATPSTEELLLTPAEAGDTLGGQILGKTQNPIKGELPPINPFEEAQTNPLKDIYRNPFE